jgi:hypothetical protein
MDLLPRYFSRESENHRRKLISLIASGQFKSPKYGNSVSVMDSQKSPAPIRAGVEPHECRPRAQNFDLRGCIAPAIFPEPFPTQ